MDRVDFRIIAMRQPERITGDRSDLAGDYHVAVRKPLVMGKTWAG
jgi:hypothetical protein